MHKEGNGKHRAVLTYVRLPRVRPGRVLGRVAGVRLERGARRHLGASQRSRAQPERPSMRVPTSLGGGNAGVLRGKEAAGRPRPHHPDPFNCWY